MSNARQIERFEAEAIGRLMSFVGGFIASKPDAEASDAALAAISAMRRVAATTEDILIRESKKHGRSRIISPDSSKI